MKDREHRWIQGESGIVPRDPEQPSDDLTAPWEPVSGLEMVPRGLGDPSLSGRGPLRQPTMLPPPPETFAECHHNRDSDSLRGGQALDIESAIAATDRLDRMAEPAKPPTVAEMCKHMSKVFAARIGPERMAEKGWQKKLDQETRRLGRSFALPQGMISDFIQGKKRDYRLSTLLKFAAYAGVTLDELVGLKPSPGEGASKADLQSIAERLEDIERRMTSAPAPSRVTKRA